MAFISFKLVGVLGEAHVYINHKMKDSQQQVVKLAVLQDRMRQLWTKHVEVSDELKEVGAELVDCLATLEREQFIEGTYVAGWAQESSRDTTPVAAKPATPVVEIKPETPEGRMCYKCGKYGHLRG